MDILILPVAGALAGLLAGLFGIGGGLVVVPVLAFVFASQGVEPQVIMHIAIGTSLATIIPTALSSIRAHHKRGAVDWATFRRIVPGIIIGGALGGIIADLLDSSTLKLIFACFLVVVATQMIINKQPSPHRQLPGKVGMTIAGTIIGTISSLMGVGGGTMSVPFQAWCNVAMRNAVATSAAIGLPIAISGAFSFLLAGLDNTALPEWTVGYINLPAFVSIVVASILFAPLGASLAHRLNAVVLKRLFAVFLYIVAIKLFIG